VKSRSRKHEEALARKEAAAKRSPRDQINRLNAKGLRAVKERAKLHFMIRTATALCSWCEGKGKCRGVARFVDGVCVICGRPWPSYMPASEDMRLT
jgi:hypothetical protein